ncbi:MAG: twin-arginine translocase subunit TatC [Gammaproteobacteria bacterium]|nr:twin-arginine translocase subunit TatC [Gammaproteobacteria bacterium]MCF6363946.1 twin-arginine translocase subunit TatC [Gammaproteobacteria bacterium]
MTDPREPPPLSEQPFVKHLIELRDRLLRVVLVIVVIFIGLFPFANDLYHFLAEPLMRHMPAGTSMIATEVASPFLTPFKLSLVTAMFAAVPFILYQAWAFIAPGLYLRERKLVFPLLFSSTLLFYAGMAFAYFAVFPLVFGFLTGVAPEGVAVMTDISRYLDFVLKMFFAFGLAFEVPIATILVVWSGMSTAKELAKKRPYIIVGAFVFAMLLTPPDVISQTLLAIPMWILFELGLIFSRWYTRDNDDEAKENSIGGAATAASAATAATVAATEANVTPVQRETAGSGDNSDGEKENANDSGHGEYEPLSEEEMDTELDRIEAEEAVAGKGSSGQQDTNDTKSGPDGSEEQKQ